MQNRIVYRRSSRKRLVGVVAAAVFCAVSLGSCSSGPVNSSQPKGSVPSLTAELTVNGKSAGTTHDIRCSQDGWSHTIETGNKDSGVTLVVNTEHAPIARSVVLTNVGGFTGTAWQYQDKAGAWKNQIGKAEAAIIGTTFKVSGTADGANTDDPNKNTSTSFEIKANC